MKILFVTGGDECECRGKGVRGLCVKDFEEQKPTYIYTLCKCVVAKEATLEEMVKHNDRETHSRIGDVVPKENESEPNGS